jgi:FAD synthase
MEIEVEIKFFLRAESDFRGLSDLIRSINNDLFVSEKLLM